ncbi:Ig-like domain-containing protein, partial [Citrobacter amalonaticus]
PVSRQGGSLAGSGVYKGQGKTFRLSSSDPSVATATASDDAVTITGAAAGTADIVVMTNDGLFVAICSVTVS